jgi:hypothetical protein
MPIANIRGVHIHYQVLGEHSPWVALSPGGRRDLSGVMPLATQVAAAGYRCSAGHGKENQYGKRRLLPRRPGACYCPVLG